MTSQTTKIDSHGRLMGSILMIAGCCIGAGMISLPAVTALCGFLPSILVLSLAWGFMVCTGLLLLEVTLLFPKDTNLLSISHSVIGKKGQLACAFLFIFLFFSLIIAYLSGSGMLLVDFFLLFSNTSPPTTAGIVFIGIITFLVLAKSTSIVDWINRIFVTGMVFTYILLVFFGAKNVTLENLSRMEASKQLLLSLPVLLISFGYQNLIPSITSYLDQNKEKIQKAIYIGSSIPFVIYLIWEMIILGLLNTEHISILQASGDSEFIIRFLQNSISSPYLVLFIQLFSLFALLTSLITVGLSFRDFLKDRIWPEKLKRNSYTLALAIVSPPLIFAILIPNLFVKGLSIAGGLGAVLLFGLIPIIMSWKVRYTPGSKVTPLLVGGKPFLLFLALFGVFIFMIEILRQLQIL